MSSARNTTYRIEISANAAADLDEIYFQVQAQNSLAAARWYNKLEKLVFSLDHLPERGHITPEDRILRQLIHGNKPHFYRVIYSIDQANRRINIVHIRHGARSPFDPAEMQPQS